MIEVATIRDDGRARAWPTDLGVDPSMTTVLGEFMLLCRIHRQLMHRAFSKQRLHPAQALCIAVLAHHGELTQSELADVLILSRPGVTRLVQRMERSGFVQRRPGEADQRQTIVSLAPAGLELQHRMHEATVEYAISTLSQLSPEDRAELARILPVWRVLAEAAK